MKRTALIAYAAIATAMAMPAAAQEICTGYGPQTPRDITSATGTNPYSFSTAPAASEMNLCNIHLHVNAEHKGPGFSVFAGKGDHGGYQCNETTDLTEAELAPLDGKGAFKGVAPGDTIEVHWVHTSCDVDPGKGLGSCSSESCANPQLRVETQVFLLVNDADAPDFDDYRYDGTIRDGVHQAKSLPSNTGTPVEFAGSTTGPSYTQSKCSPLQVTWSVRPSCAKLDIASIHAWAEAGNVFEENHAHGVRQLVTDPSLLARIQ